MKASEENNSINGTIKKSVTAALLGSVNLILSFFIMKAFMDGYNQCNGFVSDACGGGVLWSGMFLPYFIAIVLVVRAEISSIFKDIKMRDHNPDIIKYSRKLKIISHYAAVASVSPIIVLMLIFIINFK